MLSKTGIPTKDQVASRFPDRVALIKPKAILECYEDIPCNPCSTSCPFNAIEIGANINHQPKLHTDLCTGCAMCVPSCPGLAIIIAQIRGHEAVFKIPYEFLPMPEKGEIWHAIDRSGEIIGDAKIERVQINQTNDHTAVVTAVVPIEHLETFVTVRKKV
ncbi:MAG: 4Fe-4S dicluster domain-containing protein [Acholeplasmataceae bacterium]|jgi:Fe-S-cluster-containing hydrogenase component 2|nr:4Fe-4S binding protein [Acholeplasmataceae bacterium]